MLVSFYNLFGGIYMARTAIFVTCLLLLSRYNRTYNLCINLSIIFKIVGLLGEISELNSVLKHIFGTN